MSAAAGAVADPGADPGADAARRPALPHRGGLDLLKQLLEAGYLEILSRAGPDSGDAARTVVMLDGDVIVQVSARDLDPAFWARHQALVERRLAQLQRALRLLTGSAILTLLAIFLGAMAFGQRFEAIGFAGFAIGAPSTWLSHGLLPIVLPAAATALCRLALRLALQRRANRVFGRLRL